MKGVGATANTAKVKNVDDDKSIDGKTVSDISVDAIKTAGIVETQNILENQKGTGPYQELGQNHGRGFGGFLRALAKKISTPAKRLVLKGLTVLTLATTFPSAALSNTFLPETKKATTELGISNLEEIAESKSMLRQEIDSALQVKNTSIDDVFHNTVGEKLPLELQSLGGQFHLPAGMVLGEKSGSMFSTYDGCPTTVFLHVGAEETAISFSPALEVSEAITGFRLADVTKVAYVPGQGFKVKVKGRFFFIPAQTIADKLIDLLELNKVFAGLPLNEEGYNLFKDRNISENFHALTKRFSAQSSGASSSSSSASEQKPEQEKDAEEKNAFGIATVLQQTPITIQSTVAVKDDIVFGNAAELSWRIAKGTLVEVGITFEKLPSPDDLSGTRIREISVCSKHQTGIGMYESGKPVMYADGVSFHAGGEMKVIRPHTTSAAQEEKGKRSVTEKIAGGESLGRFLVVLLGGNPGTLEPEFTKELMQQVPNALLNDLFVKLVVPSLSGLHNDVFFLRREGIDLLKVLQVQDLMPMGPAPTPK